MGNGGHDLGDGLLRLKAGGLEFSVDALAWMRWWALEMPAGSLWESLDAAKAKLAAEGGPPLNDSQADALLNAVREECEAKKKRRLGGPA
jgi:hypothetical protein